MSRTTVSYFVSGFLVGVLASTIGFALLLRGRTDEPLALIVDSPWIPGYLGISHLDYLMDPEVWFRANEEISSEYPEVIFFPGAHL